MYATKILIKIAINTLVGIVFILIWLQFVNLKEVWTTLSTVKLQNLWPVFLFMLASPVIRALRLKIFLSPIKKIPFLDLIFLNGAATMLNFLIPIRAGEWAKGIYLNQTYNLPIGRSFIWIFLDRFIDFLVVLILATGLFFVIPTSLSIKFITVITIIFLIGLILIYLMVYKTAFAKNLFSFLSYLLIINIIKIYFYRITNYFLESFIVLKRNIKDLAFLILLTVLAYGVDAAIWYYTFLAINYHQQYLKMYLGQLLSALTYLIPAAPGYVGSAEASGLLIFTGVFGIEANIASSMVVLFHLVTALFVVCFGVISVYFLKLDLGLVLKKILNRG